MSKEKSLHFLEQDSHLFFLPSPFKHICHMSHMVFHHDSKTEQCIDSKIIFKGFILINEAYRPIGLPLGNDDGSEEMHDLHINR